MDIRRLKEFCHLADSLSFAETSRHFYMSQSVLSKHIASMEDELGVKLFSRDSHHVRLTKHGQTFREDAESIINRYEQALFTIKSMDGKYSSSIRIGYMRNAARPFMEKFVTTMVKTHPDVHVDLRCMEYSDVLYALSTGSIDMALALNTNREIARNHVSFNIYKDHFMVIVNANHALASQESIDLNELKDYKLLLPDPNTYSTMSAFIDNLLPLEFESKYPNRYQDVDTLFLLIAASDFVGFSSEHNTPSFGNKVRFIPIENVDTSYYVSAIMPAGKKTAAVEACIEVLTQCRDQLEVEFAKRRAQGLPKFSAGL